MSRSRLKLLILYNVATHIRRRFAPRDVLIPDRLVPTLLDLIDDRPVLRRLPDSLRALLQSSSLDALCKRVQVKDLSDASWYQYRMFKAEDYI